MTSRRVALHLSVDTAARSRKPAIKVSLLGIVLVAVTIVAVAIAVSAEHAPDAILAVVIALLAMDGLALITLTTWLPRRGRLEVQSRAGCLQIPSHRLLRPVVLIGASLASIAFIPVVIALFTDEPNPTAGIGIVTLGFVAAAVVPILPGLFRPQITMPRLELTRQALTYVSGREATTIPWRDLQDSQVIAEPGVRLTISTRKRPKPVISSKQTWGEKPARSIQRDPKRLSVNASLFHSDPDLMARIIRFYTHDKAARTELGTDAAIDRLRVDDFG